MGVKTKVALISSVALMGVGGAMVGYSLKNGANTSISWDKENHKFITTGGESTLYVQQKTAIDSFEKIDIDVSSASVNLIPDDNYYIEYSVNTNSEFEYRVDNGCLTVGDKDTKIFNLDLLGLFDNKNVTDDYVNIYYPAGTLVSELDANLDMGGMIISGIDIMDAQFDLDMGGLIIEGCYIKDCQIDLDMGELDLYDCMIDKIEADLDMGGLDGKNIVISDMMDLDLDMGSVDLKLLTSHDGKTYDYGYDMHCDMGNIEVNGDKKGHDEEKTANRVIKISCDMGSIKLYTE